MIPLVAFNLDSFPLIFKDEALLHHLGAIVINVLLGDFVLDFVDLDLLEKLVNVALLVICLRFLGLGFVSDALEVLTIFNDFLSGIEVG